MASSVLATEIVPIQRSGDNLELNEYLGEVAETLDSSDAQALQSFYLFNAFSNTSVNQYMRFQWWDNNDIMGACKVVHDKDDYDIVDVFLHCEDGEPVFQYEMEFTEGLISPIDPTTALPGFVGQTLIIMGEYFNITQAYYYNGVLNLTIANPTREIVFTDTLAQDGFVDVNQERIEDADVNILFQDNGSQIEIFKITHTLTTDGLGGDEPYIPIAGGLVARLDEPEGMLAENVDIVFDGITAPDHSEIELRPSGNNEYRLSFTNTQNIDYSNVRLAYLNNLGLSYGDDNDYLVFDQGSDLTNPNTYTIHRNDWFVVTHNGHLETGISRVLRFDSATNSLLQFTDVGTGGTIISSLSGGLNACTAGNPATATLNVGGYSFDVWACQGTDGVQLLVDLDDDTLPGGKATIVQRYGGIIDLGSQAYALHKPTLPNDEFTISLTTLASRFEENPGADEVIEIDIKGDYCTSCAYICEL
ncbi:hypothetical protein ACFL0V_03440 [Nanoarchaeota archaeon]